MAVGANRNRLERDMDDEMRFHIDMEAQDLVARGWEPADAERQARVAFGSTDSFKEEARDNMALRWMNDLRADIAFGLRSLRRAPAFTAVAVIALGIGIGSNATVFGFADSVVFRKLAVRDPDRIVAVFATQGDANLLNISYPTFDDIRGGVRSFRDAAAFTEHGVSVTTPRGPTVAWAVSASDNYFDLLGVQPVRGHLFKPGDSHRAVVVLSQRTWEQQFASDPQIVWKAIRVNGLPFTVSGVAPASFTGTRLLTYAPALWLPVGMTAAMLPGGAKVLANRGIPRFNVIARLNEGVSISAANADAQSLATRLSRMYPQRLGDLRFTLIPNAGAINPWLAPRDRIELVGKLLLVGVWMVLLIACADVANLLLARMTVRRHEISVRLALGASRGRLARQLLAESLVLALLGMAAAIPLAYIALRASIRLAPPLDFAPSFAPTLDGRVLIFTLSISAFSAIAFGLAPMLQAWSPRLNPDQHSSGRVAAGSGGRLREALVVAQVAVSVVILVAAGVFYRGLNAARAIDVGFDVRRAVVLTLDPSLNVGYDAPRVDAFYRGLETALGTLSGVRGVTKATSIPLDGSSRSLKVFGEGVASSSSSGLSADFFVVDENYFSTMRMPVVGGRPFSAADTTGVEKIVVNPAFANRLWQGSTPIGKVIHFATFDGPQATVAAVVNSATSRRLGDPPRPIVWLSLSRNHAPRLTIIIRTAGNPAALMGPIRGVVRSLDPQMPIIGLRTLEDQVALAYSAAESGAFMGLVFGGLAAILAAAGLFGVLSYSVSQRTREIGIRRALGADRAQILQLIVKSSARLTLLGVAIGIVAAYSMPGSMSAVLYGISPHDPLMIAAAAIAFLAIAAIATLGPALRAVQIEPAEALRTD